MAPAMRARARAHAHMRLTDLADLDRKLSIVILSESVQQQRMQGSKHDASDHAGWARV